MKLFKLTFERIGERFELAHSLKEAACRVQGSHCGEVLRIEIWEDLAVTMPDSDALERHNYIRSLNGELIGE